MVNYLKFSFLVFPLLLSQCTKSGNSYSPGKPSEETSSIQTNEVKPPIVIAPETCPEPVVIKVPTHGERQLNSNLKPPLTFPYSLKEHIESGKPALSPESIGLSFFTRYTTYDGLPLDGISCSMLDHSGNLWFGTLGGGVSRYDGKSFTNFSTAQGLATGLVSCVTEDTGGKIWIGTIGFGIFNYDGKCWTRFTSDNGIIGSVNSIIQDKAGNYWFGTSSQGLYRYDGEKVTRYTTADGLASNTAMQMIEDDYGNLWIMGLWGSISRYDGRSFSAVGTDQGLLTNQVSSLAKDRTGNIWFGQNGYLSKYDGHAFTHFGPDQGLVAGWIFFLTIDQSGKIWFSTDTGDAGVTRYDGISCTQFGKHQGLTISAVNGITEDQSGNLWFSTLAGGVCRYNGSSFINFPALQGLQKSLTWALAEDQSGGLWIGTWGAGVTRYDGQTIMDFSYNQNHNFNNDIHSIRMDANGNLLLGTNEGVFTYDGKFFINYTKAQGLPDNTVNAILTARDGTYWFGTDAGVARFDGKSFTHYTKAQGLADNRVKSILEDNMGSIWFATDNGLSVYNGDSFINFTTDQGLPHTNIQCIIEDQAGNLWCATDKGVSMLTSSQKSGFRPGNKTSEPVSFQNVFVENGLPDNTVSQILQTKAGTIYAGTNQGICEMTLHPDGIIRVGTIYNSVTGFPVKDVNSGDKTMFEDSKGIIWIATGSEYTGLVRFDPSALRHNRDSLQVVLQNVKLNDQSINWYSLEGGSDQGKFGTIRFDSIARFYPVPLNLVLPHSSNTLTFEYNAVELGLHSSVKYQYMLEGYDTDWIPQTHKTTVTYGNIPPGSYNLRIKACSPEGVWGIPLSYPFKVLPAWYLSFLAILTWIVLAAGVIFLGYRIRFNQLQRRNQQLILTLEEKIKERTAELEAANKAKSEFLANMSHEIRTPMNAVLGYADLLDISLKDKIQKEYVDSLKSSGRGLLTLINGILDLSKIEAGRLELEFDYINTKVFFGEFERIFSMKIAEKGLQFILDIASGTPAGLYVDENRLRQVMFNLIGNAIKFTDKGQISVRVSSRNAQFIESGKGPAEGSIELIIEIEDTGIGVTPEFKKMIFDPFTQQGGQRKYDGTGLGLAISKRLVTLMNGTITLESESGIGSTFRIDLPEVAFLRDFEPRGVESEINIQEIEFDAATILVADDIISNRKYFVDALKDTKIDVREAEDGLEAYELADEIKPDLIITDILMPRLNGFELLNKLKQNARLMGIPVIAYSASVMKEEKEKIHRGEFAGLLTKPVRITELFQILMEHIPYVSQTKPEPSRQEGTGITGKAIVDLPGLILAMETGLMDIWKSFAVRQPINEVREFGRKLKQLGTDQNASMVSEYGESLIGAADSFNIEAMLKLLKIFPDIISDLKNRGKTQ